MRAVHWILIALVCSLGGAALAAGLAPDWKSQFKRPSHTTYSESAPYSPQIAALGKMLFFDPRLSGSSNMSCASCHNPSFGWEVPTARAVGTKNIRLARHAPTIENLAEAPSLFWDGRAQSLEHQARGPITHPFEMNSTLPGVQKRLSEYKSYRDAFDIAFPGTGLTEDNILTAIATFERTLQSGWAPFDAWIKGDEAAISAAAKRGFALFVGKADCVRCHTGWAMTDHDFHDVGTATSDRGRNTDDDRNAGRRVFKTPGLRNISIRAPYMHNGALNTLQDVLHQYNRGGADTERTAIDVVPLNLDQREINDLVAFLETLAAYDPPVSQPALPVE